MPLPPRPDGIQASAKLIDMKGHYGHDSLLWDQGCSLIMMQTQICSTDQCATCGPHPTGFCEQLAQLQAWLEQGRCSSLEHRPLAWPANPPPLPCASGSCRNEQGDCKAHDEQLSNACLLSIYAEQLHLLEVWRWSQKCLKKISRQQRLTTRG